MVELGRHADAPNGSDYSLMEFNFSLFWGLAIQAYEATLVSDETPADRFFRGDTNALSAGGRARPRRLPAARATAPSATAARR